MPRRAEHPRTKRLALIARHRNTYERKPDLPLAQRHMDASRPGEKVQLDCFYLGRLSGTKCTVWQYRRLRLRVGRTAGASA